MHHLQGLKTDTIDRQWLQLLHSSGLLHRKDPERFTEYLRGNWRARHLLNLESAPGLCDAVQAGSRPTRAGR